MISIGVTNQKGGVGKTTTAVNLAVGLAQAGKRVLVVDMDPQGNGTSGLGVPRDNIDDSVYEAMMGHVPVDACLHQGSHERLWVLPSDIRLIAAEKDLLQADGRESRLAGILAPLTDRFDYALVDAPPSLGLLTLNVLRAVDHLIIPVQSEYYALEGLSMLVETIERVKATINPHLEILGVLLTMVDGRTNLSRQVCEEVLRHFGDKVFHSIVARSVRLSEAPSHGQSILDYEPRSAAAEVHRRLTQEVIARCEHPNAPRSTPGLNESERIGENPTQGHTFQEESLDRSDA